MIPVKQTRLGKTGNCFEACIASLLNLEIEQVPDLLEYEYELGLWVKKLNQWLAEKYKLVYMKVSLPAKEMEDFFHDKDFYYVMSGVTHRSSIIRHAVIGRKGVMVHDPHPDNAGIQEEEMLSIGVLVSSCF